MVLFEMLYKNHTFVTEMKGLNIVNKQAYRC